MGRGQGVARGSGGGGAGGVQRKIPFDIDVIVSRYAKSFVLTS